MTESPSQRRDCISPVQCTYCRQPYDLCDGKPVARYSDCTVYITPCCGRQVDDRPAGWTSTAAFRRLTAWEAQALRKGRPLYKLEDDGYVSVWHV